MTTKDKVKDASRLFAQAMTDLEELMDSVEFGEIEGGTEDFKIKVFMNHTNDEGYLPMYGIYNVATGLREGEQRQYHAAKVWARVLTQVANGQDIDLDEPEFPGLTQH
jgi:hypothetical protein